MVWKLVVVAPFMEVIVLLAWRREQLGYEDDGR